MVQIKSSHDIEAAELVGVIRITKTVGSGSEHDPIHQVDEYWTADGEYIGQINTKTRSGIISLTI